MKDKILKKLMALLRIERARLTTWRNAGDDVEVQEAVVMTIENCIEEANSVEEEK